ncbi:MAG: dicarboxylate/amino acid:cation symporter [Ignavibacteriaceae bacterium]|nr:dicarboxylate/amino acid:cation symporter [Ignavibacteriaceae bacterium]NNL21027.1 dicarboxylate/amino acid:cation symporter [Ignavibacteriaceae bacterium]
MKLHWQILFALVIAILYGLYLTEYAYLVTWMGVLFLRALQMIIIPLILTSIISGVTNIGDAHNLGRLGFKTISYYITTSLFAIVTGLVFVNLIQPGVGADLGLKKDVPELAASSGDLWELVLRMIPTNIFEAFVSFDILAIIVFSILFGFFITRVGEKPKEFLTTLFNSGFEVMMKLTHFVIRFTPLGILGIVVGVVAEQRENLVEVLGSLGKYSITVLIGLFIHGAITLPLIIGTVGKVNPWKHFQAVTTPLLTAFSTRSSSATLPLTIDAVENNSGVSNKISSFVLPLGATINMDGTALYECVAAMFIAQAYAIELGFLQQMIVVITALLASIGAAGIPMAGLVMISVILTAAGLPLEGVGLILAVDPFLDMCRTSVNVWSDSCGTVTIAKTEGENLNV